ncbi:hypothetical protein CCM_06087 [Cordyceps militaris CM01]|uniref:MARVEL domain-containing protein n=2 Tax=Cordyceps militaris TaxID=73501 RepID=G3JIN0_CORMM|nr:uncharacterized protein CCM_06087 [Cordyceps militaris CM01]ATY59701.1 hypothetical protein A9K55_003448 [Cordyceps militaris]EGX91927.1 hypothetical protein CCM_06087 [Cordyceps militaris CM01]
MIFALVFVCTRISQITTLIIMMGMLSWFVDKFVGANVLAPTAILILFIVSVLALAWALFTLFSYHRSSANAFFVAIIDIAIVGALIAGIYHLSNIRFASCSSNPAPSSLWTNELGGNFRALSWSPEGPCHMLKAIWAFAIMNAIFFAWTAFAAFMHGDHFSAEDERRDKKRRHSSRHSQRRRSRSRSNGSYSHHSHHSHRVYV